MLVMLDRDGVINFDSKDYIKSPTEWLPIPGSLEAIASLTKAGIKTAVITNQSGIARGLYDVAALDAMHAKMQRLLASFGGHIDAIYYCPHHPNEGCACRKPKTMLLQKAAADFNVDIQTVPFIGDRSSDVEAALACGAIPYLISEQPSLLPCHVFSNVSAAVAHIFQS